MARATGTAPDLLDAEATQERPGLARGAGALTPALAAAEGLGAASPAERMIAHQMATAAGTARSTGRVCRGRGPRRGPGTPTITDQ